MSSAREEALKRARTHLQQATIEGLEAARVLLQAAMHSRGLAADVSADSWLGNLLFLDIKK